jgi:uncharacterized integral membrane protein (TIGR00697 family)
MEKNVSPQQRLRYFDLLGMAFVSVVLVSSITASKLISFGPFTFTAGIIIFPLAYIFGDTLTEVYGYAKARRIVWMGFAANLFMSVVIAIAVILPPAQGWELQEQFAAVLGQVPRIVFASLIAYICGEFANSYVLAKMKLWTEGKHLWTRTIGSTIVGEGIDTVIFVVVAFWGLLPGSLILTTIISAYIFKVAYEIIATPLTYIVVGWLKRAEGVDHYDRTTNFNPFHVE